MVDYKIKSYVSRHEISNNVVCATNNVVCATNKTSDQPVHTSSPVRACASRLNIL